MSYILGIDPSQWQGAVNFNQVKAAGYQFSLGRMTYSYPGQGNKIDPNASKNYYGAFNAGMVVGGYHKVGWTDPIAEADFYLQAMSPLAENDLLAYDMEPSSDVAIPANWSAWEQTFVQRIIDKTNTPPLRYLNISMNNAMPAQGVVTRCASWVAAPSFGWDATVPVNVPVTIQQGPAIHIPGIPSNVCDTDAFFGSGSTQELINQLKKIGFHNAQPAPTTPPPVTPPPPVAPPVEVPPPLPVAPPVTPPVAPPAEPPVQPSPPPPAEVPPAGGSPVPTPAQSWIAVLIKWLKTFFGIGG